MHAHDLSPWRHDHVFDTGNAGAERRTRQVVALTVAMMVAEILAGWWTRSIALMADGRSNAGIVHRLWIAEPTVEISLKSWKLSAGR